MNRYTLYRINTTPKSTRTCSGVSSFTRTPIRTRIPTMPINPDMPYPKNVESRATFNVYFPCNLNRNGMETHTETGPFFIMAGVKIHCIAASVAG